MAFLTNFLLIFVSLLNLSIGLLVFLKKKTHLAFVLFLMCSGFSLWVFLFFCAYTPFIFEPYLDIIAKSMLAVSLVYANAFYYFSALFPNSNSQRVSKLNVFIFVSLFVMVFNKWTISNVHLLNEKLVFDTGPGYALFSLYVIALGLAGLYYLIRKYLKFEINVKSQLKIIFLGMAFFILSASLANVALPILGQ